MARLCGIYVPGVDGAIVGGVTIVPPPTIGPPLTIGPPPTTGPIATPALHVEQPPLTPQDEHSLQLLHGEQDAQGEHDVHDVPQSHGRPLQHRLQRNQPQPVVPMVIIANAVRTRSLFMADISVRTSIQ